MITYCKQALAYIRSLTGTAALMAVAFVMLPSCTSVKADKYTLDSVQGYWWENCNDPAVQFAIQGTRYFGDFEGELEARVEKGFLIVDRGDDSRLSYRIVSTSPERLVLQSEFAPEQNWLLRSCPADTTK